MGAMTKLTRDQFIPFLDTLKDTTFATSTWKRIDYSTIFELTMNEQEEGDRFCSFAILIETGTNSDKWE